MTMPATISRHGQQPRALAEGRAQEVVDVAVEQARLREEQRDHRDRAEDEEAAGRSATGRRAAAGCKLRATFCAVVGFLARERVEPVLRACGESCAWP